MKKVVINYEASILLTNWRIFHISPYPLPLCWVVLVSNSIRIHAHFPPTHARHFLKGFSTSHIFHLLFFSVYQESSAQWKLPNSFFHNPKRRSEKLLTSLRMNRKNFSNIIFHFYTDVYAFILRRTEETWEEFFLRVFNS